MHCENRRTCPTPFKLRLHFGCPPASRTHNPYASIPPSCKDTMSRKRRLIGMGIWAKPRLTKEMPCSKAMASAFSAKNGSQNDRMQLFTHRKSRIGPWEPPVSRKTKHTHNKTPGRRNCDEHTSKLEHVKTDILSKNSSDFAKRRLCSGDFHVEEWYSCCGA